MSSGRRGDVAILTYTGWVDGVRLAPEGLAVHVIARYGTGMAVVAGQIRAAVAAVAPEFDAIDVFIEDLLLSPDGAAGTDIRGNARAQTPRDQRSAPEEGTTRSDPGEPHENKTIKDNQTDRTDQVPAGNAASATTSPHGATVDENGSITGRPKNATAPASHPRDAPFSRAGSRPDRGSRSKTSGRR
jgi:hypothetical protein